MQEGRDLAQDRFRGTALHLRPQYIAHERHIRLKPFLRQRA